MEKLNDAYADERAVSRQLIACATSWNRHLRQLIYSWKQCLLYIGNGTEWAIFANAPTALHVVPKSHKEEKLIGKLFIFIYV